MRIRLLSLLCLFMLLSFQSFAQDANDEAVTFIGLQRDFAGATLGYRKATIEGKGSEGKALVIYLHGGSSCGTDNSTQMAEPGIDSIAHYLVKQQLSAVFVVPQCSDRTKGWGGMAKNVKALLDFTVQTEGIDPSRIYIFGGSMGGTGTWKLLSTYPHYFAAAMPCAANPKGMSADNVATTPVYNVMGLADNIMGSDVRAIAESFIAQLQLLGDDVKYETVPDWSHEITCIQSYSTARLNWVFAHSNELVNGIESVYSEGQTLPSDASASDAWYTLMGVRVSKPSAPGLYLHHGKKVVVK